MVSSPLRYPGGKAKMFNQVLKIMQDYNLLDRTYVEPFAGGFGIGIKLLTNGDVSKVIINDADKHIYAFWYCVFFRTKQLIRKIKDTPVDVENWKIQKDIYCNYKGKSLLIIGFSSFYLNRTNYSGVLKGGPIGGFEQEGKYKLNCRFNTDDLIKRIEIISKYRDNVEIFNLDAVEFIGRLMQRNLDEFFINFDPPYVHKGHELYRNYYNEADHKNLFSFISQNLNNAKWIMTYDDCEFIKELYSKYNPQCYTLTHTAGEKKKGKELLIKNLNN